MIDEATVARLARHWDEGGNGGDVDVIMAPFAANVVFRSPFVPRLTGDPAQSTIEGQEALWACVTGALERASASATRWTPRWPARTPSSWSTAATWRTARRNPAPT